MANEIVKAEGKKSIVTFLTSEVAKKSIEDVVGKKDSQRFVSALVSAVQTNPTLSECTNNSLLNAALIGHSLNLPQSPQLSYFYLVPFNNSKKGVKEATFQLGYRGYIQLAMRSGQYQKINACDIREGELKSYNPITDEYVFEPELDYVKRGSLKVVGYYGYFILNNGFKKEIYWDKDRMEAHAKRYSASYRKGWDSFWKSDFDEMARKTIIRQLISKWGIMSVDLEKAYESDMAVIRDDGSNDYIDNVPDEPTQFKDVLEVEAVDVTEIAEDAANET